jgi:hypothetical protein
MSQSEGPLVSFLESDAVHQGDIHWSTSFWPNVDGRVKRLASETNPQTLGSGFSVFAPPSCTSSMCITDEAYRNTIAAW